MLLAGKDSPCRCHCFILPLTCGYQNGKSTPIYKDGINLAKSSPTGLRYFLQPAGALAGCTKLCSVSGEPPVQKRDGGEANTAGRETRECLLPAESLTLPISPAKLRWPNLQKHSLQVNKSLEKAGRLLALRYSCWASAGTCF